MQRSASGRLQPFVVVLTGGPSSGKSSALAILRDRLSKRGFQALTVPENATHFLANSDGFQPEWAGTAEQVKMQRIFLDYQLAQEEAFKQFAALHPSKPAVLLLDRCTLDSKIYVSDQQWQQVLRCPGHPVLKEEDLLARYDLVIHMVTCALEGHYEWGPGSNNPGRYHTPEQAKETDDRGLAVFGPHHQMRLVPHFPKLNDKILQVLDFVTDAIHVEGLAGKRKRKTVRVSCAERLKEVVSQVTTTSYVATTTFLDDEMQQSVRKCAQVSASAWLERWMRRGRCPEMGTCLDATEETAEAAAAASVPASRPLAKEMMHERGVMYERRKQVRAPSDPSHSYLARKVIAEDGYFAALEDVGGIAKASLTVTKSSLCFVLGSQYYELFFFLGRSGLVVDIGEDSPLPPWLEELGTVANEVWHVDSDVDCASVFLSNEATPAKAAPPPEAAATRATEGAKRSRRVLWRHTTEEAAHGLAKRPKFAEPLNNAATVSQDVPAAGA